MKLLLTVRGSGTRSTALKLGFPPPHKYTGQTIDDKSFTTHVIAGMKGWDWLLKMDEVHTTLRDPHLIVATGRQGKYKRIRTTILDDLYLWKEIFEREDLPPVTYHPIPWGGKSAERVHEDVPQDLMDFYEAKVCGSFRPQDSISISV